jgi:aminopeptidase N
VLGTRTTRDLAGWSHVWVEEAGRPLIRTDLEMDSEGRRRLAFEQRDPKRGRSLLWTQQIDVLMGTPAGARDLAVELRETRTDVPGAAIPPRLQFVLPAGGGLAYGGFTLDDGTRKFLLAHVEELKDPVARGATWITLWDEMLDGRVDPSDLLDAALRTLPREDTEQNVRLVTSYVDEAFWRFVTPAARLALSTKLERTLRAGLAHASSSSLKSTYFSAFRNVVTTPDGLAFLERAWRRREKIPGLPLAEPDEATLALELAVRSVPEAGAILEEQRGRFQNPDRKARFEFVMPALSDRPGTRDAFFASLSDVKNRRREPWVIEGLRYLNHPLRAQESQKYLRPSLDLLEEIQRTGDIFFPTNWTDAVLGGHNTRSSVDVVRAFLDEHSGYPVRLRRIILQSADDLFRAADIVPSGSP